jgi:hypothetical protein
VKLPQVRDDPQVQRAQKVQDGDHCVHLGEPDEAHGVDAQGLIGGTIHQEAISNKNHIAELEI